MIKPDPPLSAAAIMWVCREVEAWRWSVRNGRLRLKDLDAEPKAYLGNKSIRELVYLQICEENAPTVKVG